MYHFWAEAFKSPSASFPFSCLPWPSWRHMLLMASLEDGGQCPVLTPCEGGIPSVKVIEF